MLLRTRHYPMQFICINSFNFPNLGEGTIITTLHIYEKTEAQKV